MPKFFSRRKEPYNLRSRSKNQSTPKSKVDACVECDLPFDESKIAPELRRGPVAKEGTSSELLEPSHKNSVGFNKTNLEPVDISVDSDSDDSLSALDPRRLRALVESEEELSSENEREKEKEKENCTDNIFATGSQQVPASTSPVTGNISPPGSRLPSPTAPLDPTFIEQPEVINTTPIVTNYTAGGQQLPTINSPADIYKHFSRKSCEGGLGVTAPRHSEPFSDSDPTDDSSSTSMDGEYIRALTELTEKLLNKDVNINKFHGYENEDINRWFEKLELVLDSKGIRLDVPAARTQLINNLAGPAETFMFELPPDERRDYDTLKRALVKRYSTKDRAWVKRRRLVARRQGPNELLSDYINEMHELFSGLNMAEVDKVTYFTEGLLQPLKTKVLERMPETLLQAEEVARTVDSISQQETSAKESSQIERLIEAITRSQQVPAQATGTNASLTTSQQQSLHAQMETITQKLSELTPTVTKSDKVAAYSEPQADFQNNVEQFMRRIENQMTNLEKRMDAHITGLSQRQRETRNTRERSRDGRPCCYVCGLPGHYQNSCPRRNNRERDRTPVPRYALPAPDNYTQYSSGPQARQRALPPPPHQSRIAAFQDSTPTSSSHPELPKYDSPKYDSFDWNYYYGDFNDDDFYGHWDYYYNYESETEASNNVDELDGVYEETPPTSVSTLVENLHSTVTTDQLLLPPFPFQDPCPSSWTPEAAGLLLEGTRAVPNQMTELPLANFGKNPEQPQQGPILSATPQLGAGMSSLPPFTDKVDQLADSFKMETEFDPPIPATNPVPTTTAIRSKTTDTTILGHYTPADHEPKAEPAMTYSPAPVDILPPPYPGDVGVDPIAYFGLNYPKPELAGYSKVALRMAQPPQTKEVKQKSTATAYSTLNADNHVTGDSSRSRYGDLPTENPTVVHSGEKTVSAQNVREMVTTQVSKQVKSLTNQETDRTTKLEQNYHVAPKAIPSDQSSFPCPEIGQPNPDTGQPGSSHSLRAQIVSTEPKTRRATHSQLHKDYQQEIKDELTKVIKDMEGNLLSKITILERRWGANLRHSKVQPRKRTCFYCGMVGHIQINCPHRSCQQGSYSYKARHKPERIPHQTTTFQPTYTAKDESRCQDSGEEPYYVNHNETKVGVILNQPKEVLKLGGLNSVAANSFKQTLSQIPNVQPDCRTVLNSTEREKPKYQQNTLISPRQTPSETNRNQQVSTSCTEKYPPQALQSSKTPTVSKNVVKPQKTGKSPALQLKIPFMFEKFISWFMLLVVIHLCFASQAHSLPQVQPAVQKVHNMHDCRQSEEKEFFSFPKYDGRLTTKTHTRNWYQPVSSTKFKYNFPLLNDDPPDALLQTISPVTDNGHPLTERRTLRGGNS